MSIQTYSPNQTDIIHETAVDFISRQRIYPPIHIVQYDDTLPLLAVSLYKNGIPFNLQSDMDINIRIGKRDKTFVCNPTLGYSSTNHNVVYFKITRQMTILPGKLNPVIEILKGSSVAASGSFEILIDRNPVQKDDMESTDEWESIKEDAKKAEEYAKQAAESKDAAAKSKTAAADSEQNAKKSEDILKFYAVPVIPSTVTAGGNENYKWITYEAKSEYAGKGIKGIKIVNFLNESKVYIKQVAFQNYTEFPHYANLSMSDSYKLDGAGVKAVYNAEKQLLEVTLPMYQGIVIYSPNKELHTFSVSILCDAKSDKSVYILDNNMTDGIGQNAAGAHEVTGIKALFGDLGIWGDTLIMRDYGCNTFQSIVSGFGTYPNKPVNNSNFSPYELYLYHSDDNTRISPGELTKKDSVYASYYGPIDIRYTLNCETALEVNQPLYLKGRIFHGCFTFETNKSMYTQKLPVEEDGYVYIYVGEATDTYQVNLSMCNPIYCYKNGYIRTFNEVDEIIEDKITVDVSIDETELRAAVNNVLKL